ncbi:MAG: hypothetical protein HDS71_09330 [Bacteroidales bacterium]|nr:hypothetical protein [Bacteroidales bacterium]
MKANNTTKRVKTIEEINAQAERLMQANETWYQDAKRVNREPINRKAQIVAAWHNTKIAAKELQNTPETSDTMNTETNTVEFSELSHAGQCLDLYLHNTAEIYERYTVEAVKLVVNAFTNQGPVKLDDVTAWDNLTFWISWQPVTKKAVTAAVKLVKKYDHMTPTAKDIEQVTRNYAAYIVESAKYEVENN